MTLNGWQRLWLVLVVLCGALFVASLTASGWDVPLFRLFLTIWVIGAVFVYAVGWSVGWIRRGFNKGTAR